MSDSIHFEHTALVAYQRDPVRDFVLDLLGGRIVVEQKSPEIEAGFRGVQIDIGGVQLEVIEPTSPASFLHPYLAKRGPGLHHMTWYAPHIDTLIESLRQRDVPITGLEHWPDGRVMNVFIRPSASFGVLLQFRPFLDRHDEYKITHPDWLDVPSPVPHRGRLASTAIAVHDGAAAISFFHETLGGTIGACFQRDDAVVRTLHTGGTVLELLSPSGREGRLTTHLANHGSGIIYVTFELTKFDEAIQIAKDMGLTIEPGDSDRTAYLRRDNPANALFRFVDVARKQ